MDQKSLVDFCSFVRFVFWCAGRSSEARYWVVNWSPSGSVFLRLSKPWLNRKSNRSSVTYRINWEDVEDKEVRNSLHTLVYHLSSDSFLLHPRTLRRNGCCSDQPSFHQLLKVQDENGLEWRTIVKKEHLVRTKRLKKLFEQRKMRSRPCYRTDCHLICILGTLRREKRQLWQ